MQCKQYRPSVHAVLTRPSALGKSDPFCGPSNPWYLFTKDYTIFCGPGHPRYLFTKDYAIFSQMIVINKKFCTVINLLFKLFKIVFFVQFLFHLSIHLTFFSSSNSSPSGPFSQFFHSFFFLENMIICIVQILPVFCLHGLHYEKNVPLRGHPKTCRGRIP